MHSLFSELFSWLTRRFRGRVELELEMIALRHQLAVLRRQRPGRTQLFSIDRLIWVWLYRLWPRFLKVIVVVKPATVIQWHRQSFRLYWRWRSRSGRPAINREVRDLIRQMCNANPLWGAPRIHGELLKLGIEVSQATVAKYMLRRRGSPSSTWRSFLRNQAIDIAAIDMFVVPSATFRQLFVMLILTHDRRKIVRFAALIQWAGSEEEMRMTPRGPDHAAHGRGRDRALALTNGRQVSRPAAISLVGL
jgi:hypothetical protein